jgi:hypothetical protein
MGDSLEDSFISFFLAATAEHNVYIFLSGDVTKQPRLGHDLLRSRHHYPAKMISGDAGIVAKSRKGNRRIRQNQSV